MRRWWKRSAWAIGAVALLLAGAVYWLFYDGGPAPRVGAYALDLTAIRREALRLPGPMPVRIEDEITSHTPVPAIAMTSGENWRTIDLVRVAYRLVYPDRAVMIDTGDEERDARHWGASAYDRAARARVLRALDGAMAIVVTHEHGDHLGGALTNPHLASVTPRLLLTAEQLASRDAPPWPGGIAKPVPLVYTGPHAIGPGVVLVKAPGHTPGSQLIYVRRADGHEFLFLGDVASMLENVTLGRQRSRYVTSWRQHSDRQAVADEIAAIRRVAAAVPALTLVPGHDAGAIAALERHGLLSRGFRF